RPRRRPRSPRHASRLRTRPADRAGARGRRPPADRAGALPAHAGGPATGPPLLGGGLVGRSGGGVRRPGGLPAAAAVLVALAAAATLVALRAEPAAAMTQARLSAAGRALRPVVHGDRLAGARPDWALVIDA